MTRLRQKTLATLFFAFATTLSGGLAVQAAPKAELWARWSAHDPDAGMSIDHAAWRELLRSYVIQSTDGVNRVRYGQVTAEGRQKLDDYIQDLESISISRYGRSEQLAYWINLYNAVTVRTVLEHYPVERILDIKLSPGFFSFGPWDKKLIRIESERLSLNDIEHRILRPIWGDPRIHYAVNCASIGCPNLRTVPYAASELDTQLTDAAKTYINHPRGTHFEGDRLVVSSIYHWYKEDFGGGDEGVIEHLRRYAEPELAARLADETRIDTHRYDWALNDAASTPASK